MLENKENHSLYTQIISIWLIVTSRSASGGQYVQIFSSQYKKTLLWFPDEQNWGRTKTEFDIYIALKFNSLLNKFKKVKQIKVCVLSNHHPLNEPCLKFSGHAHK